MPTLSGRVGVSSSDARFSSEHANLLAACVEKAGVAVADILPPQQAHSALSFNADNQVWGRTPMRPTSSRSGY